MRLLKISAALLVVLLLVGDRVGAVVAANVIATRLQTAGSLSSKPDVSIRGFPFLTQAVSGRYDRIELRAGEVRRRTVSLDRFEVDVTGARVDLGDAIGGRVASVPVERLSAQAVIGYATLASRTGLLNATVTRAGDKLMVAGQQPVAGRTVAFSATSRPSIEGTTLRLSSLRIAIGTLPYGLRITGVSVGDDGIVINAMSGPTVLQKP